ncbi:MAG TPA: hypothetical protein VFL98_03320 [Candidatus Paceibacterota bacterium]|nr:hypothetical protein [Candidatus Paceibacterota bacterium]
MIDTLKSHKVVAIVIVVIVLGGLWYIMGGGGSSSQLLESSDASASASGDATVAAVDQELQSTLAKVRAISLDDSIMSDPAFLGLTDIGQQIVSEPFGRSDPFAPISSRSGASSDAGSAGSN